MRTSMVYQQNTYKTILIGLDVKKNLKIEIIC